jgi:SAM-dependent methyltransferase
MENFNSHEVSWTQEKINNFWNYFVTNSYIENQSYAKEVAPTIIRILKPYIKKDGANLDYGCGAGNLMFEFFKKGIQCSGLDPSEDSIKKLENRFRDNQYFKGAYLSNGLPNKDLKDNSLDFIFSLECLEHLIPVDLDLTLNEFYRLLKPGGYIFITVPNKEKLDKYKVMCPDCGCIFHRVQHINSFQEEVLSKMLNDKNFDKIFSKQTIMLPSNGIIMKMKKYLRILESIITRKQAFSPHLVYLGRKK